MKKILTLVLVSALGGVLTLGAYKYFLEGNKNVVLSTAESNPTFVQTNNVSNAKAAYEAPDLSVAAENSINTVVHVKNLAVSDGQMTIQDLFMGRHPQQAQIGSGSGVIITADGYIVTNNHVIDNSQELSVTLNNNKTYEAKIIGSDPKTDIALIKIDADEDLPYATFGDSDQAKIGEWVLAVGNPFNLTSTVTAGIISAKSRSLDPSGNHTQSFIQTDAAVNPGNSGGALVNTKGELIGINTAITSQTGSYIGYSFAVPSNIARKVIEDIMEYGNVQNGVLGVTGGALNSAFAKEIGIDETEGFYVQSVMEDSGAEKAGIKNGDIIKEIDGLKISKFSDLSGHLSTKRPDDVVNVVLLRDGSSKTLSVVLTKNNTFTLPMVGQVKNAKKEDLKKFKVSNGIKIVQLDSKYADYWINNGVKEGSIITAINDQKIETVDDAQKIIKNRSSYDPLRIELINTNGEKERYNFR
ncbi:trypsin-like peptidase domain-containing protein [Yeosuana marina]|mgnify:CR=1 FL=1|uniref:trypsin-like peptidase domain-containing protein n=1 Tax=Yeosuana marina TaxID=1565536 RepID=UPI0030ECF1B0|tara:strand:- start:2936 stop:4345 length:1410 start_codon:yes stop_codon:yes gene_type:complete